MLLFSLFLLSFACLPSTDFFCSIFLLCPYALFQILLLFRGEIRCPGRGLSLSCASMSTHLFLSLADLCNDFGLPFYSSLLTFPAHRLLRPDAFSVSLFFFSLCFCFPSPDSQTSTLRSGALFYISSFFVFLRHRLLLFDLPSFTYFRLGHSL